KFKLRKSAFDLRVPVENAVKLLRAKAREKHLGLVVHVEPDVPTQAYGDEARLRQILLNLVGNAVKFTEQGAVTLVVSKGEGAQEVEFFIHDSGVGIPEDKIRTLFDRFTQVDGTNTREYQSSGLGLAICKELVSAMGGDIGCSSVVGQGSVFRFCVPLTDRRAPTEVDERPTLATSAKGRRFVFIDDVSLRGSTLVSMMTAHGARADHYDDPEQAIDALRTAQSAGDEVDAVFVSDCHNDDLAMSVSQRLETEAGVSPNRVIGFGVMAPRAAEAFAATLDNPITANALKTSIDMIGGVAKSTNVRRPAPSSAMRSGQVGALPEAAYTDKVLIVDDVPANRKLVECILNQQGVTTVAAENGQHAVEIASAETFGLILMDVYMPVMGGIDAAMAIRQQGLNQRTPIVALTATASAEEHGQALQAGMQGVLTKPLNIQAMKKTVADALKGELVGEDEVTEVSEGDASA
ncbi:MAG: response regulator, partial [Parvularculaceae bacterium]|nr:response regulator [Parvularculaceae bacterium]